MKPPPIRPGHETVTPYLIVSDAVAALDFYSRAFGATELVRLNGPGGQVIHAEMAIGPTRIMLAGEAPQRGTRAPQSLGGTPVILVLYVEDSDASFAQALAAGATQLRPVADQFYGDRSGSVVDPFGHQWMLSTQIEEVSDAEMQRRCDQMMQAAQTRQ